MAETLRGHAEELSLLVDDKRLDQVNLSSGIEKISAVRSEAQLAGLGRQAAEATRLYVHYLFEESQRAGVSPADFKASLIERGIIMGDVSQLSELEEPVAA